MSFRFNFSNPNDPTDSEGNLISCKNDQIHEFNAHFSRRCDFLSLTDKNFERSDKDISLFKFGDLEVQYILTNSVNMKTEDETFSQIDALQTDLIPGKYEGGLKIWECSIDLATYLVENSCIKNDFNILELGCGAGLPGIVAYLKGASVTFQDFNPEVLEYSTLPNTVLNTNKSKLSRIPEVCHYLYGDWEDIRKKYYCDVESAKKYDVILTSETIYEKSNQKKLLELMKCALKPNGTIYLAAKIHYFGVGGGIVEFETLINLDKSFEIISVHKITGGVERQILVMKFRC